MNTKHGQPLKCFVLFLSGPCAAVSGASWGILGVLSKWGKLQLWLSRPEVRTDTISTVRSGTDTISTTLSCDFVSLAAGALRDMICMVAKVT